MFMARLLFPSGKLLHLTPGAPARSLGRADVARYPEALTVSRVQCLLALSSRSDGALELQLTSKGSTNPTLALPRQGPALQLNDGQSTRLHPGDAFSLISTRPDLGIEVQLEAPGAPAQPPQQQQQQEQQQAGARPAQGSAAPPMQRAGAGVERLALGAGGAATAAAAEQPAAALTGAAGSADAPAGSGDAGALGLEAAPSGSLRASDDGGGEPSASPSALQYTSDGGGGDSDDGGAGTPGFGSTAAGSSGGGGGGPQADKGGPAGSGGGLKRRGDKGTRHLGVGNGKAPATAVPPVLLMLAGLPGSGKSTFSRSLLETSPVAWVHVNQDAIRAGGPGTREQCVAAARTALGEGACCVLDRCHGDADQRRDFLALAAQLGRPAHCVALQLPTDVCAKRVAARTDHPGQVQGDGSKRLVYSMAKQQQSKQGRGWPPAAAEGFASVMDCHNDADAAAAVRAWALYGGGTALPGAPPPQQAEAAAAGVGPGGGGGGAAAGALEAAPGNGSAPPGTDRLEAAATAATASAAAAAPTLACWQAHVARRKPPAGGIAAFFKPVGAAAAAATSGGGGGAVRSGAALVGGSGAGGPAARAASGAGRGAPAGPAPAARPLVSGPSPPSPTARGEPPGLGPQPVKAGARRAHAAAPPADGRAAKRQALEAPSATGGGGTGAAPPLLSGGGLVQGQGAAGSQEGASSGGSGGKAKANAFSVLMASAAASRPAAAAAGARGGRGAGPQAGPSRGGGPTGKDDVPTDPRFQLTSPWCQALRATALNPDSSQQAVLHKDDEVVMVSDAFPKARHHALVLARDPGLRSIADLGSQHAPLLAHMRQVAERWVREQRAQDPAAVAFKLGFHAVPSMCQLHLHVISQDFDSPSLKNKKHWNTFTTSFFLSLEAVEHELQTRGRVQLITAEEEKRLESLPLRCHGCGMALKNLPELKKHIVACGAVRALPGL